MRGKYGTWLFLAAVMILPVTVFSIVSWYEKTYQQLPVINRSEENISSFHLTNQYGREITNEDLKNKIIVADFFFTHCTSICPKMTKNLKRVEEAMKNDTNFLITSFSIDPERDSVPRLLEYANRFGVKGNWHIITGDKREIYRLARNSFMVAATDGDGGPGDFIHSEKLVLVDKAGRIRGFYDGTSESEVSQLIKDIKRLKASY